MTAGLGVERVSITIGGREVTVPRLLPKRDVRLAGDQPAAVAWAEWGLWITAPGSQEIVCLDRDTGGEIRRYACARAGPGVCFDGDSLWVVVGDPGRLRRVDPATGSMIDERGWGPRAPAPAGIAWQDGGLWIADRATGQLARLQAESGEITARFDAAPGLAGVEVAEGAIWFTDRDPGLLVRLDPRTGGELARFALPGRPGDLCFDGRLYWYVDADQGLLRAVRP